MALTDEQAKQIKEQIFSQLKNLPEEQAGQIKSMISKMNNSELEQFLIKNKMMGERGELEEGEESEREEKNSDKTPAKSKASQCVYCMIGGKQMESFAIYDDKDYLGVLEIKPLSKGQVILIPKKHVKDTKSLTSRAFTIANKIGRHITRKLGAENFQINSSDELGHAIINIVPTYKNQKLDYERKSAKKQELQELAIKIGELKKAEKIVKIKTEKSEKHEKTEIKSEEKPKSHFPQLPRRIP